MTDQDIFERLRSILIETFDIGAETIKPQARLREDLDIDSIDAVDLIVRLKPLVGKRLQPDAFKAVRTLQDVIEALQGLMKPEANAATDDAFAVAVAVAVTVTDTVRDTAKVPGAAHNDEFAGATNATGS